MLARRIATAIVSNRRVFTSLVKNPTEHSSGSASLHQLSSHYEKILAQQNYIDDPEQRKLLAKLAHLKDAIESQRSASPVSHHHHGGFLSALFRKSSLPSPISKSDELSFTPTIRGMYIFGGVGCGKTAMMDIFYDCLAISSKHRTHFHSFMLDVHMRLHKWRQSHAGGMDPVPSVAAGLVNNSWVYCFDEFQVTDVADALIMKSLFSTMLRLGAVFLITSNRAPEELYQGGTQRAEFIPFINLVNKTHDIHRMPALLDYRTLGQRNQGMYTLASAQLPNPLWSVFLMLAKDSHVFVKPTVIPVMMGRELAVPHSAGTIAYFSFDALCCKPLGAADYIAICRSYRVLFIEGIPLLRDRNEVRRLITLVDNLYESRIKVFFSAAAPLHALMLGLDPNSDELFAWDRLVSRVTEMQTNEYWIQCENRQFHHANSVA
jgi:predicted ATPase